MSVDKEIDGETQRVLELDQSLQKEGLRSAKCLKELISCLQSTENGVAARAAHAIRRALPQLRQAAVKAANPVVLKWIQTQDAEYVKGLAQAIVSNQACAITKSESEDLHAIVICGAVHSEEAWKSILRAALFSGKLNVLANLLRRYADLRVAALKLVLYPSELAKGSQLKAPELLSKRLKLLVACTIEEPEFDSVRQIAETQAGSRALKRRRADDESEETRAATCEKSPQSSMKLVRKLFGDAWIAVLSEPMLTANQRRDCLSLIAHDIIPRMTNPLRLSDFLTATYNTPDTEVAISALDGLFVLVSEHKLDYPLFYPKLYALLTPGALFYAVNRKRFLDSVVLFLTRGKYIPGGVVAAFIKRLVRRALMAPPVGAMWCLRLALELIHKHPGMSCLVHRSVNLFESSTAVVAPSVGEDPFDDMEVDPQKSGADRSSLWELETLRNHVAPGVSRLAEAFARDPRKTWRPSVELGELSVWTFNDLFLSEYRRRAKSTPLAYDAPGSKRALEVTDLMSSSVQWTP